jgi:hypothetical protein
MLFTDDAREKSTPGACLFASDRKPEQTAGAAKKRERPENRMVEEFYDEIDC